MYVMELHGLLWRWGRLPVIVRLPNQLEMALPLKRHWPLVRASEAGSDQVLSSRPHLGLKFSPTWRNHVCCARSDEAI